MVRVICAIPRIMDDEDDLGGVDDLDGVDGLDGVDDLDGVDGPAAGVRMITNQWFKM